MSKMLSISFINVDVQDLDHVIKLFKVIQTTWLECCYKDTSLIARTISIILQRLQKM